MHELTHLLFLASGMLPVSGAPEASAQARDEALLRAAVEAELHALTPCKDGHRAHDPRRRWSALFDGRGMTLAPDAGGWSFGLALLRFGRAGSEPLLERPRGSRVAGARLAYEWSESLEEWYLQDARGLEHGFTLHAPPPGEGPLSALLALRGGLVATVGANQRDVLLRDEAGAAVLSYAGLHAFDADGAPLAARIETCAEGLRILVDDAGARYPVTIDPIVQEAYLKASNTGANDSFGWSIAIDADTAVVGAYREDSAATGVNGNQADNSASNSGAAYVFVRDGSGWSQQAYLKASNSETGDNFGWTVAIDGDTVVVGANKEDGGASGVNGNQADNSMTWAGAAYVFVRNGTSWAQEAYLKASNPGASDEFGYSLSLSGDTLVVGAPGESSSATGVNGNQSDNSMIGAGAAYVFVRNGTSWSQQAYLKASNTGASDRFGWSVGLSGDTVVVGAHFEDSAATGVNGNQADNSALSAGAAYVFFRNGTSWSQQAYLKASNTEANDNFGQRVAADGNTVVVAAQYEDSAATGVGGNQASNAAADSGAVYVFVRSGTSWSQQAYVKATNTDPADRFGFSLALEQDTLVVGTPFEDSSATGVGGNQGDNGASNSGAAYVYRRSGTSWSPHAYLKASNTEANDEFGQSVGLSANRVVVGAYDEDGGSTGVNGDASDNSASNSGAAYVFDLEALVLPAAFCFGSNALCPCGNGGLPNAGCDNPQATGGVSLLAPVFNPDLAGGGSATLQASGYPPAAAPAAVVLRSTTQQAPTAFGDGLLCAAPPVVRLAATTATAGSSLHPLLHGAGAGTFHYQVWYRSNPAGFCTPQAFNVSSALTIVWP